MSARTYCTCKYKIVRHPIYGDQNQVAQAVAAVQNGTLGRACGTVEKVSALVHSPPLEGWQAYAFCNVCV